MTSKTTVFQIKVNGTNIEFQPDCGADVSICGRHHVKNIESNTKTKINLQKDNRPFKAANSTPVNFDGFFNANLTTLSGNTCQTKMYVLNINPKEPPLLGELDLLRLNLISYHPTGYVKLVSSAPNPTIEITEPKYLNMFQNLHQKYNKVFQGLGCLKDYVVDLQLTDNATEFFHKAAPVPVHLVEMATARLKEYIKLGLFEWVPNNEPILYCSSLLVIEEKKNKLRLCGDYRKLNSYIKRVVETPAPRVETFLERMRGAKYFLKTDMNKGYWQLLLSARSRRYCTLSTHLGCIRPCRVPMGVKISGNVFDARVASVLQGFKYTCHNRDDIMIGAPSLGELYSEWEKLLKAFAEVGFTLSAEKTIIGLTEIVFHGVLFNQYGCQPDPNKVSALRSAPRPVHQDGLLSFICTVGFNQRFIHRFAEEAQPLRILAKSKGHFDWQPEHEKAFQYLKNALCDNTLNNNFVKGRQTAIFSDAGKKQHTNDTPGALSSVLAQKDPKTEEWLPITFASRVLTDVECRYSQVELEALSIVFGVKRFQFYVIGCNQVFIYTDCQPLVTMFNKILATTPPRIMRMIISIQEIDYLVIFRPGKTNCADFLSRNPPPPGEDSPDQNLDLNLTDDLERAVVKAVRQSKNPVCMNTIRDETLSDPDLQFLIDCLKKGNCKQFKKDERIKPYISIIHELSEIDNILYKGKDIIVLPQALRHIVVDTLHSLGHQGEKNTMALVRQYFYFPNIYPHVNSITRSCEVCQQTKLDRRREPYGIRPVPRQVFNEVSADFKGPLPNGYYVLVLLEILSRFPDVAFVTTTSLKAIREPLIKYFSIFGTSFILRTDRGPPFGSKEFEDFANEQGFKHDPVTPRSPIANSEVERVMATVGIAYARAQILNPGRWKEEIINAIKAKRATPHPALGMSPYEVVFGRKMRPANIGFIPEIHTNDNNTNPNERYETVADRLYLSKKARAEKFSKQKFVHPHDFRVGDTTWFLSEKGRKGKHYEPDLYQITHVKGNQITAMNKRTKKIKIRHSTHFKLYVPPLKNDTNEANNFDHDDFSDDSDDNSNFDDDDNNAPDFPQPPQNNAGINIGQNNVNAGGDARNNAGGIPIGNNAGGNQVNAGGRDNNAGNNNANAGGRNAGGRNNAAGGNNCAQAGDHRVGDNRNIQNRVGGHRAGDQRARANNRQVHFRRRDDVREFDQNVLPNVPARATRSHGAAPELPHVLRAPPERSAAMRREINDIHRQHNRAQQQQQQQQQNPPNQNQR